MSYAADVPQASTARFQVLEYAVKEFPAVFGAVEIYTLVTQSIEAVNTGEQSPEEALAIAQERA